MACIIYFSDFIRNYCQIKTTSPLSASFVPLACPGRECSVLQPWSASVSVTVERERLWDLPGQLLELGWVSWVSRPGGALQPSVTVKLPGWLQHTSLVTRHQHHRVMVPPHPGRIPRTTSSHQEDNWVMREELKRNVQSSVVAKMRKYWALCRNYSLNTA